MDDYTISTARNFEALARAESAKGEYEKHNEYIRRAVAVFRDEGKAYKDQAALMEAKLIDVAARRAKDVQAVADTLPWDHLAGVHDVKRSLVAGLAMPLRCGLPAFITAALFYGPPGTGKTQIVASFAQRFKIALVAVHVGEVMQKFMGDSEKEILATFARAATVAPSIVFIDEVDALMTARSGEDHGLERRVKNTFLQCLTSKPANVFVFAATNCAHELDDAFKRRFSHMFAVGLPVAAARRRIIETRLPAGNTLSAADIDDLVAASEGLTGSEVVTALRNANDGPYREICDAAFFRKDGAWRPCGKGEPGAVEMQWEAISGDVAARPVRKEDIRFEKPLFSAEKIKKYMQIYPAFISFSISMPASSSCWR